MKNKDDVFFNFFSECAEKTISICSILEKFEKAEMEKNLNAIYNISEEIKNSRKKYLILLEKAFITPIDREVLLETTRNFTDFSDSVKDIAASVYYTGIYEKREEDTAFYVILKKLCDRVKFLSKKLLNFKSPKNLKEISEEIRKIEMEGEKLYVRSMKKLFLEEKDTKKLVCCQKINAMFLKSFNAGGNIARQTEKIIIGKG